MYNCGIKGGTAVLLPKTKKSTYNKRILDGSVLRLFQSLQPEQISRGMCNLLLNFKKELK